MQGKEITLAFDNNVIYDKANFLIRENEHVGIVGVNGAGKTTLLKLILGIYELSTGKIIIPKNNRIGYLPQEVIVEEDITVIDYLLSGRPIDKLNKQLLELYDKVATTESEKEQKKILNDISKTQELLEYYDCYNAENTLFTIIEDMSIPDTILNQKMNSLSGGQKSKVAFAKLLYSSPEIMLLDEPTNHLDHDTRDYIIRYLKNYHGMILMISHDYDFLNSIVTRIMHIDKITKKIKIYNGNYNDYKKKEKIEKVQLEKLIEKQEAEEKKLRDIVLLYSNSSGKRKRMAQSREKQLEKLQKDKLTRTKEYKKVKFKLKPNKEGSKIPLKVNRITFGYTEDKILLKDLSFVIENKERFLIVGVNGVGKSTLLKLIVGELKSKEGLIWYGNKTEIAYYSQEQENLDLNKTILENIKDPYYNEKELRTVLGNFLFHDDDVLKKVGVLSPGEKARISLCKVMLKRANLLVLDEPTNHLDPITQEIIGENFKNYEGTIIVVSHNPVFVDQIGINRMLILPKGKIVNYNIDTVQEYYLKNTTED